MSVPCAVAQPIRPDRPDFFERGHRQFEQEIQRLEQQQPSTTPILTVESAPTQWNPVLIREGGFVVWMPQGVIDQNTRTVETSQGAIAFESVSSNTASGRFLVAFSEPVDIIPDDPEAVLERVQDRISGWQTGFGVQNAQDITFDSSPGRDFTLVNDEETIFFRLLLIEQRLYVLALSQRNEIVSVDTKVAFFNSFQIL
jgi:hypothetical protein